MKPIAPADRSNVISLLLDNKSLRHIASKLGVSKSTVHRIKEELDMDKENIKPGRPSKLSPADRRNICRNISTGRFDTAVEVAKHINKSLPDPVTPETV